MNVLPARKKKRLKNMVQVSASNSRGKLTTMKSRVMVQKLLPLDFTARKTNKPLMAEKFALFWNAYWIFSVHLY